MDNDCSQASVRSTFDVTPTCQIEGLADIYAEYFGDRAHGGFVDVGAADGVSVSNTSCFPAIGWSGLLFEPDADRFEACRRFYEDYERVTVVQACVGSRVGEAKLFCDGSTATIVPEMIEVFNQIPWLQASHLSEDKYVLVPIVTLDTALRQHGWEPGFEVLSIDVEGAEIEVLHGFSIDRWAPRMAIVECCETHRDRALARNAPAINAYFDENGYDKIYCDAINSIFVRRDGSPSSQVPAETLNQE